MACQKCEGSPFAAEAVASTRARLKNLLKPLEKEGDRGKPMEVRLAQSLAEAMGDPEWALFSWISEGVPLGAKEKMPRAPAVFERKTKWTVPEAGEGDESTWAKKLQECS